jgi:rSAM/selenodomain-associated transferase 1
MTPHFAVAVLAKAPVAGLAKTRLAPLLGAAGAARAQRQFTLQTLKTARLAAPGFVTLWCAPDAQQRFFRAVAAVCGVSCLAQPAGDLGARMAQAFDAHFAQQSGVPLLLIGTDCPILTPMHLTHAAAILQTHDAVVIPAEDGGYVLIGLRRPMPRLFSCMTWSTPHVMEHTRERLARCFASWQELDALWDVDEPADWLRWQNFQFNSTSPV